MAEVNIQNIIDEHSYEMKRALETALNDILRDADFDRNELYRAFKRAVDRKLSTWVKVSDRDVKMRCPHCRQQV